MAQELDFDDAEIKALGSWIRRTVANSAKKASEELPHSLEIDIPSVALKDEATIRPEVPADAISIGLKAADVEGSMVVILDRAAALSLARDAEQEDEAFQTRLGEESTFSDDEKTALTGIQEKLAAALVAESSGTTEKSLEAAFLDVLSESTWGSGEDPVTGGDFFLGSAKIKVGETEAKGLILMSPTLVKEAFPQALEATDEEASAGVDGDFLFYPASASVKDAVLAKIGVAPNECQTVAELMRGFLDEATGGAIIGVDGNETHILSLLRGMKELPGCEQKKIIVVLEKPTTANVVRCGRLGLFDVLPAEFEAADFAARANS